MESFYVGLGLAILSTFLIGISFVFKKKGLIILAEKGVRAGNGGYGYLREWIWWTGMILMALGEIMNFAAYSFAPASLVTPLGALSVLVTAVASSHMLSERMNIIGKLGCILCVTGSSVIILHAPKEQNIKSFEELQLKLLQPGFILYFSFIFLFVGYLIVVAIPKWGKSTPLVYVLITGSIGSLTVISCKGLGVAAHDLFSAKNIFSYPFFWVLLMAMLICVTCQLTFLNRALDIFNITVITPILYVVFTSFVLGASSIAFSELVHQQISHQVGLIAGFVTVVVGIILINAFQHIACKIKLSDLIFAGPIADGKIAQSNSEDICQHNNSYNYNV